MKNQTILVGKEDVRKTILELKAEGIQQRKRKKLDRHIDGHDDLKLFGFSVPECIDGLSRKLKQLEVTSSNKVPEIISQCYLKAVKRLKCFQKKWKQMIVLSTHSLNPHTYIYAALMMIQVMHYSTFQFNNVLSSQSTYWVLLIKICCRQTWLVQIIFSGYGRFGNIWSTWTHFVGLYQVLLYQHSAKITYRHCKWMESTSAFAKHKQHPVW